MHSIVGLIDASDEKKDIALMVVALCNAIHTNSEPSSSEFSRFVVSCGTISFSQCQTQLCMSFSLDYLSSCSSWYVPDALRFLEVVIRGGEGVYEV